MQAVILAGGKGTRLAEETKDIIPKPMVEIGGVPILYHIMKIYSMQGCRDFIVAAGHHGGIIGNWLEDNYDELVGTECVADDIMVIDTGEETQTGGRLLRLADYLPEKFFWTYGDGLGNVNLRSLIVTHTLLKRARNEIMMTLTAVHPPPRFGVMRIEDGFVTEFGEKRTIENAYINGGFYYAEKRLLDVIPGDDCRLEFDLMPVMARQRILGAHYHNGYWQMMDTPRDLGVLENDWLDGEPWLKGLKK